MAKAKITFEDIEQTVNVPAGTLTVCSMSSKVIFALAIVCFLLLR